MQGDRDVTPMLVFAIFSAVLGMFQFGFNTGVINAPQKILEEFIANIYKNRTGDWISEELRDVIWSITVSIFAVGGMIGGLVAQMVANWCGRKTGLVLNNTVAILGVTLMSSSQLSQSIECLIIGRFFIGLNCGLSTALVPMYLTEISTINIRGALGTVSQLGVTIGLLFSQVLGLKEILGTKDYWPFLFGVAFIPAVLQLIMLPFCPESPRYLLLSCGRVSEARLALRRLRNRSDVEDDMEEMRAEERSHQKEVQKYGQLSSVRELFNHPWLRTPLIISIMMQLSQQLSGINAIFYYSTDIFLSAEVPENYAVYATMGIGFIMVIMTLVSIPLMDRLGRRTLHLYGLAGMFLASIFLTISLLVKFLYDWMKYISVISILFYTLFFGVGPGSIPFMITAELFTQGTRPAAMSVATFMNWMSNFAVGLTFPIMKRVLQSYLFLPFTVFLAIFWIFIYKKLPETKNRTFEEIAALFKPIHLAGGSPGFPDYGCTLAGLGVVAPGDMDNIQQLQQANTPGGSLNTPGVIGNGGSRTSAGFVVDTASGVMNNKGVDRFRFDLASTGKYIDEQQHRHHHPQTHRVADFDQCDMNANVDVACCDDFGRGVTSNNCHRGSHGKLHHQMSHTSCTSLGQANISTSDQQPLIVEGQPADCGRCSVSDHHHHHQHRHHQHNGHNHHHHQQHEFNQGRQAQCPGREQCCLRTTSFMMDRSPDAAGTFDCTCCAESALPQPPPPLPPPPPVVRSLPRLRSSTMRSSAHDYPPTSRQRRATADDSDSSDLDGAADFHGVGADRNHQRKSKTLTRIYKPLNDLNFPNSSANNLIDNFCLPVSTGNLNTFADRL